MKRFLFLGGDLRMLYAAEYLNKWRGAIAYGFEKAEASPIQTAERIIQSDYVVLPLPLSFDAKHINAPYHYEKLDLSLVTDAVKEGGAVFTGKSCSYLEELCSEKKIKLYNYFEREELQIMNAVPTAEGALEIILKELPITVFGLKALITGFGRVGEGMARALLSLGASVSVAARRYEQMAKAREIGCKALSLLDLRETLCEYDVFINTVPAPIFGRQDIRALKKGCLIIDLASESGFENAEAAREEGVKMIWALSLPGLTAPVSAGRIIGMTIENILKEERNKEKEAESQEGGEALESTV